MKITTKQLKESLGRDCISKNRAGNFVLRVEYFYRHGKTSEQYADEIRKVYPNVNIVNQGDIWKPFKGSAPVSQNSHFFVEFNFNTENSIVNKIKKQ